MFQVSAITLATAAGLLIEDKFIRFEDTANWLHRLLRLLAAGVCAGELSGEASGVALGGAEGLFSWRSSPLFFSQLGTARTSKVTLVARSTTHSAVNRMFRQFGLLLCGLFRV